MVDLKDFIIVGAGQAGLSIAYYLGKKSSNYLVVDANKEVGAPWMKRWDSLKLFTPSEYNNMPGMDFPHKKGHYANKIEVAQYLKDYVAKFNIPISFNQKILNLKKEGDYFVLQSENTEFKAKKVIIATGPFHKPFTPRFHTDISAEIVQIHSENYKNPQQLQEGTTVVVGAGDSGVQILKEISESKERKVYFSGNTNISSMPQEILGKTLWWWFDKLGLLKANKYSWIGKKLVGSIQPVIGTDVKALFERANVSCLGRCLDASNEEILFEKGTYSDVKNIIWATGFKPNFHWIENITLDEQEYPKNYRGVSKDIEGLYFIGLPWLYTRGSATLGGVNDDASYISEHIFNKN